jgi:hypothetical protein
VDVEPTTFVVVVVLRGVAVGTVVVPLTWWNETLCGDVSLSA